MPDQIKNVQSGNSMKTFYEEVYDKWLQHVKNNDIKEAAKLKDALNRHKREFKDIVLEYDSLEIIKQIDSQTIKFVTFADVGACCHSGELYIITKLKSNAKVYCFEVSHQTTEESFQSIIPWMFPFITEFNSIFPDVHMHEIHPHGWKHLYLGLGNHLFVSNNTYDAFADDNISGLITARKHSKLQEIWKDKVSEILNIDL